MNTGKPGFGGIVCTILFLTTLVAPAFSAEPRHPFILWTRDDIAKARKKIQTEEWAKAKYEKMLADKGDGETYRNLFRCLVMDDQKALDQEKQYLLSFIGAKVDPREWSDHYLTALRYDSLYHTLSEDERAKLEETFRIHVEHQIANDKREYRKANWLPNMQWPRPFSAHLLALALGDKDLIERVASANGGWKYYFDSYVSDGGFYNEEFGKMYSMVGEMLLWCRGLERLGMDNLGYGYTAKTNHNACMRSYLRSIQLLGMPRVDMGTPRYHYPRMTMGDAKGGMPGTHCLQQRIVGGYLNNGQGGNGLWNSSNMNGRDHKDRIVTKLMEPMWFEIAHAKWPDDRWDYFLAQMRAPDEDKYYPSLFWGLDPIDPAKVTPPPAPSGVYPERGIVVLRAEETPAFWEGPWPAVGMRLATTYAHSVPDCFALTGLFAFNRPIHVNRQVSPGYAGTDPGWSNSMRSHTGLIVDNLEPRTVGQTPCRSAFHDLVKFVSAHASGIYPDVESARSLMLTKNYLLDVTAAACARPRAYQWIVHTLGYAWPDNPDDWAPSRHLVGSIYDLTQESSFIAGDRMWAVTAVQSGCGSDTNAFGRPWFEDRIGVRLTVLGSPGTVAYMALAPMTGDPRDRIAYGSREPGTPSIIAARNAGRTIFTALHEPFKTTHRIGSFQRIQEIDDAIAVRIRGSNVNDRAMLRWGPNSEQPAVLTDGSELFEFSDHGFVRIGPDAVQMLGKITKAKIFTGRAEKSRVLLNGKEVPSEFAGGFCCFGMKSRDLESKPASPPAVPESGCIAARWHPQTLRIPTGGKGESGLWLRNGTMSSVTASISLKAPDGLTASPPRIGLAELAPGAEQSFRVEISADPRQANRMSGIEVVASTNAPVPVQNTLLYVAHGVVGQLEQVWPRQFMQVIHSPTYVVRYDYLACAAANLLLDPDGQRRFQVGRTYPAVYRTDKDGSGKDQVTAVGIGGFQAFRPNLRRAKEGEPAVLEDWGTHPHGYYSDFEYRFTEDWIWIRYKKPGTVALDWTDRQQGRPRSAELFSQSTFVVGEGEKVIRGDELRKYEGPARLMFDCPAGQQFGGALFYPPNATNRGNLVWQPADKPMAFTFCKESDALRLLKKWEDRGEEPSKR